MSKICTNCGAQLDDSTLYCTTCGAQMSDATPEVPAAPTAPRAKKQKKLNMGGLMKQLKQLKKNPKMMAIVIAAAAALLILIVALIWDPLFNPWKAGIDNYFKLTIKGTTSAVTKAAPKEVFEYIDDQVGISQDEFKKDAKKYAKDASDSAKETYGDNAKITYKVVKSKKMTKDMISAYGEAMENSYDIDKNSVKQGYVVKIEYEISGKKSFYWGERVVYVVQIQSGIFSSGWYMVEGVDVNDEEPYGTIMAVSALQSTDTFSKKAEYK